MVSPTIYVESLVIVMSSISFRVRQARGEFAKKNLKNFEPRPKTAGILLWRHQYIYCLPCYDVMQCRLFNYYT
jgi:hypothetical protein